MLEQGSDAEVVIALWNTFPVVLDGLSEADGTDNWCCYGQIRDHDASPMQLAQRNRRAL